MEARLSVKLRLKRIGRKGVACYRLVATDSRSKRDGRFIEELGSYNPNTKPASIIFKEDGIFKWLKNGAQPSDTVKSILQREGIWEKWGSLKKGADITDVEAKKRSEKEKVEKKSKKVLAKDKALEEEKAKAAEEAKAAAAAKAEEAKAAKEESVTEEAPVEEKPADA